MGAETPSRQDAVAGEVDNIAALALHSQFFCSEGALAGKRLHCSQQPEKSLRDLFNLEAGVGWEVCLHQLGCSKLAIRKPESIDRWHALRRGR